MTAHDRFPLAAAVTVLAFSALVVAICWRCGVAR